MSRIIQRFDSLSEFVDYSLQPNDTRKNDSRARFNRAFSGTDTFEEAVELSRGWTEGADRLSKLKARIHGIGEAPRRTTVMQEVGPGVISMGRYVSGHPQPYAAIKEQHAARKGSGKIVRIYVSISASVTVETDDIERRGGAILELVDALQRAGRRVEVTAVQAVENYRTDASYECRVKIKRAQDRANLPTMAFALAHPAMLRRIVFSAEESLGNAMFLHHVGEGYGTPANMQDPPKGSLYLPTISPDYRTWDSDAKARRWVKDQCANYGIRLT